jgi:glycosyltransferase involved in cell wall biosynthesis
MRWRGEDSDMRTEAEGGGQMRILVVVSGDAGSRVTGPEIRGWALARALAERHEVTVIVHNPPTPTRDGLRLVAFSRGSLVREARRHDAVVAPVIPPYLFAALRGTSTITVSDQYDPLVLELSVFTDQPDIARVLKQQRSIRDAQLRFADVIACAGERQRALLLDELDLVGSRRAAPPSVVNVPFGLPDPPAASAARPLRERFPQIGPDDPVVLWWGKVWKWFDATTALQAFALVVERRPDARLVISAGKAPKAKFDRSERTEDARQLARELGLLDRNVFFLDEWTQYDRRHEYLQDADVGLTLHADTAEAPFAARARYMDYLWSGLPCVLARGDEVADRFGASGFAQLVAPGAPEEAAAALLRLIDNAEERRAACAAGVALARAFHWSELAHPLVEAIEARVADGSPSASRRLVRSVGGYYVRRTVDHASLLARSTPR